MTTFLRLTVINRTTSSPTKKHRWINFRMIDWFETDRERQLRNFIMDIEGQEIEVAEDDETIATWLAGSEHSEALFEDEGQGEE